MKIKVHEIAKEYGMTSKELIPIINRELHLEIKSHMSGLDEIQVDKIKKVLSEKKENKTKKEKNVTPQTSKSQEISAEQKPKPRIIVVNKKGETEFREQQEVKEEHKAENTNISDKKTQIIPQNNDKKQEIKPDNNFSVERSKKFDKTEKPEIVAKNNNFQRKQNNFINNNNNNGQKQNFVKKFNNEQKFGQNQNNFNKNSQNFNFDSQNRNNNQVKKDNKDTQNKNFNNLRQKNSFSYKNNQNNNSEKINQFNKNTDKKQNYKQENNFNQNRQKPQDKNWNRQNINDLNEEDERLYKKFGLGLQKKKNKSKKKKEKKNNLNNLNNSPNQVVVEDGIKIIKIKNEIVLGELAQNLGISSSDIIKKLFLKGQMLTINSVLSFELAEELAADYDALIEKEEVKELDFGERFSLEIEDKAKDMTERAPVIKIMGHVDHGKTSLLDAIRSSNVAEGEAGGITQKIGAYQVIKNNKKITFVDTPGHEAFTDMRARGAQVTDIAILVVSADDGVMPQTVEAIAHAKAANVPIIVAINKIDKPEANPMKVRQELMEHNIVSVEWGGDTEFIELSAKKNINIDSLLDTILITAEILELKANYKKRAKGVVLESRLDPKVGPVADLIIQEGTLKIGDVIVAGEIYGKVRAIINDKGDKINTASVSQPIEIIGFNAVPVAGDTMYVIKNEQQAKRIVEQMANERKHSEEKRKKVSLEALSSQFEQKNVKELNLILRADSRGSVDALCDSLKKLSNDEVAVNIIQSAAGAITESDVKLAEASNAIIIGFNVRPTTKAIKESENSGVEIRTSNIIYHITEDIEKALAGMLAPEYKESYLGRIEIKKIFKVSNVGNIAGCIVEDGKVKRDSNVRILRNGIIVFEGKLASLKRYKDDVKEVTMGQECGLGIENYNDIKEGDIVEAFEMIEVKRSLK